MPLRPYDQEQTFLLPPRILRPSEKPNPPALPESFITQSIGRCEELEHLSQMFFGGERWLRSS
jgi:hypothetical protein